jgi:outer membrane immunogenic protein
MRNKLTSSLTGAVFSLAASGMALAADIAVKGPPPAPPAPVYNWTGFYVGGNAGVGLGTYKTDFNASGTSSETVDLTVLGLTTRELALTSNFAGSGFDQVYPGGFVGGGQIGFNWQLSPLWVVGVEGDFQGTDQKEHGNPTVGLSGPIFNFGVPVGTVHTTAAFDYTAKIEWFGTARLRAGYLFGDGAVLTYVTGGLAYGKVDVEGTSALGDPLDNFSPITQAFGHSNVNTGWVVGSGTEGKLANFPGWTYRIEGLYMDLGHLDTNGPGGSTSATFVEGICPTACVTVHNAFTAGPVHTHTHFTDTILRAGVSYQFSGWPFH